ncbi:MAG: hypothetical protein RLZZ234_187 [Candidatus Parcubacteria bacterium]|jgi:hypothetical protein
MLDAVLQFVYAYPGVLASAESDDDDIYVVPGDHEKRLHLAEAHQGGEDDDTFSR